jgi:hypothetical protein
MKKSAYKVVAEAISSGQGLKDASLPTGRVDHRRLTIDEIKEHIKEEFGKVTDPKDVEPEEKPRGWGDQALAKEIEWIKKLNLESFFADKEEK